MADLTAIASAIARRFSDTFVSPPPGYSEPATSTYLLPTAITTTPTCIVFPPEGEFSFAGFKRSGNLDFPVRWYISDSTDLPRATGQMYAWAGRLLDQLETQYDIGLSPIVTHAIIDGVRFGKLEYADHEYTGIEFNVRVHLEEAFAPTTGLSDPGFDIGFSTGFPV